MINIAIVGLGNITSKYLKGLNQSSFNIVCTIDTNNNPKGLKYYKKYPFYNTINDAVNNEVFDYVVVSTPPCTHYLVIKELLINNKNVIVEKLIALNTNDYNELLLLANSKGLKILTMYHWMYGSETLNISNIQTNNIKFIEVSVNDPYIDSKNVTLGNVIIDSLPNALSILSLMIRLEELVFINRIDTYNSKGDTIIKTNISYKYNNIIISIKLDWTSNTNIKETIITYSNNNTYIIDHNVSNLVSEEYDRLETHYYNLFTKLDINNYNYELMNLIHKLVFKQIK